MGTESVFYCVALLLTAAGVLTCGQEAYGQETKEVKRLGMADCVKVLRADSVHMFFDERYALVPPECATIRRETRMDAEGNPAGEVRDYLIAGNRLFNEVHYRNGVREGRYVHYYPNQQQAASGQFIQGHSSGSWQHWYANGQRQSMLEFGNTPSQPMRIVAYWDSTGQQSVTDGAGTWEESVGGSLPSRCSGRVVNGLMEGVWEKRSLLDKQVLTAEDYRMGRLQEGRQFISTFGKPKKYQDKSLLGPQAVDASAAIEPYHFGANCDEQAATRRSKAISAAMESVTDFPQPPQGFEAYQRAVMLRMHEFNGLTQWMPRTDGQEEVITADINAAGQLQNFACKTPVLASAFASFAPTLGPWHPATVGGTPVPGKMRFSLRMQSTQMRSSMGAWPAYPIPMDVIQKFIKK